jgi:hypothetical protein
MIVGKCNLIYYKFSDKAHYTSDDVLKLPFDNLFFFKLTIKEIEKFNSHEL